MGNRKRILPSCQHACTCFMAKYNTYVFNEIARP